MTMQDTEMTPVDDETKHDGDEMLVQREERSSGGERQISLHPLVVFNISDHYTRQKRHFELHQRAKARGKTAAATSEQQAEAAVDSMPQVIGALFGIQDGLKVAVYDSFEVKYDIVNGDVQLDKEFLQGRNQQFAQVYAGFELLGWYSVGKKALPTDLGIHRAVMEFNESPLFLLLDPAPEGNMLKKKLPITLYESELHVLNGSPTMLFVKTPFKVETSETEGICVDHISKIAPMGDANKSSLHPYLGNVRDAIKMLSRQADVLTRFLEAVKRGEVPADHKLLRQISSVCDQLPAMTSKSFDATFLQEYNDTLLVSYLAALTKGASTTNTVVERFATTQERQRGSMM